MAVHEEHDVDMHITGSVRLIEKGDADRLAEAKHHVAMASLYDNPAYPTRLISVDEIAELHPLVSTEGIEVRRREPRGARRAVGALSRRAAA